MNQAGSSEMFVLDTCTVIDIFRRRSGVAPRLAKKLPQEIAIAAMTLAEIQLGVLKSSDPVREQVKVDRLVGHIKILPFEREAALIHAKMTHEMRSNPIGPEDAIIAATAIASNAILVTSNMREFSRVPGLRIENWRAN